MHFLHYLSAYGNHSIFLRYCNLLTYFQCLSPASYKLSVTILFAFSLFKAVSKYSLKNRCLLVLTQTLLPLWLSCFTTVLLKLLLAHVESRLWWFYIPQLSESKCPQYRWLYTATLSCLSMAYVVTSRKGTNMYCDWVLENSIQFKTDCHTGGCCLRRTRKVQKSTGKKYSSLRH